MTIRVEHHGDVAVVTPEGMLTGDPETDNLQAQIESRIDAGDKKILLNLSETTFLTSRAFGVIIVVHNKAKKSNTVLYTCGMQPRVLKVIQVIRVTGWPKQFETYESALEALAKL